MELKGRIRMPMGMCLRNGANMENAGKVIDIDGYVLTRLTDRRFIPRAEGLVAHICRYLVIGLTCLFVFQSPTGRYALDFILRDASTVRTRRNARDTANVTQIEAHLN